MVELTQMSCPTYKVESYREGEAPAEPAQRELRPLKHLRSVSFHLPLAQKKRCIEAGWRAVEIPCCFDLERAGDSHMKTKSDTVWLAGFRFTESLVRLAVQTTFVCLAAATASLAAGAALPQPGEPQEQQAASQVEAESLKQEARAVADCLVRSFPRSLDAITTAAMTYDKNGSTDLARKC